MQMLCWGRTSRKSRKASSAGSPRSTSRTQRAPRPRRARISCSQSAIVFDAYLVPTDLSLVVALTRQGNCNALATQQEEHGRSSSLVCVRSDLSREARGRAVNNVNVSGQTVPPDQCFTTYSSTSVESRAELIRMARLANLFRMDQRKLMLAFGPGAEAQALRSRVMQVLAGQKLDHKQGRPPAGHMERLLSQWVQDMVS